ncbi:M67 family metallopeptidase [Sphingomonas quercus]|uniref:M67 family metallopeptidase n=1 Tax=Sphingomonas quercus TaxID=2842451 RepID=A0ABS6BLX7_9SPHN|nr:M67 family metallopeptidase [Sphingomonas quercus]MBU3078396.1 M67 family metallopeptidase [Sphingomonas quercus]
MGTAISRSLAGALMARAAASPGREVCGLLLGGPGRIVSTMPAANLAADPADSFELDPAVHIAAIRAARAGGPAVIGHYHSHPNGVARPSPRDAALAFDPLALWMIVTDADITLWRIRRGAGFVPETLRIEDGGGCEIDA